MKYQECHGKSSVQPCIKLTGHFLCVVDYHTKFPIVKEVGKLFTDILITCHIFIFVKDGFPKKIMSDVGTYFISDKFKDFAKK